MIASWQRHALAALIGAWLHGFSLGLDLHAQVTDNSTMSAGATGQALYLSACAACHAPDGTGQAPAVLGFETPVPDFTDCSYNTAEAAPDWVAIVREGGPVRAFDRMMPRFSDALSDEEIGRVVEYVRSFCSDQRWPRGDLNFPRGLVTEKAFPENEALWTVDMAAAGLGAVENAILYERRIGARSQYEVVVPIALQHSDNGRWNRGLGDVALALKHVLFHSLRRGAILSAGGEVTFPTGKESAGLGKGVTVLEPFVAFGQQLPSDGFLQLQAGWELPIDRERGDREVFARGGAGKTFVQGGFGRTWSPIVEIAVAHSEDDTTWDLVPQIQVSLTRRQHILLSGGIRLPLNDPERRQTQVLMYLLWDWFDGGFFDGWR